MFKQMPVDGENNATEDAAGGPALRQAPQQQQYNEKTKKK
jgi:hypothetical protein